MRSRVKLSLIADEASRRTTFRKRKKGMMKKLNELVTLCGVKACGVFYDPYSSNPECWPSREGVGEVFSKFMEFPMAERKKKMLDQEGYMWERIRKGQEQVKKLREENQEFETREFMFDCLQGKMMEYNYGASDIRDLRFFIDYYINELTRRIEILTENGESTFFPPPLLLSGAAALTSPIGFYDHLQLYENMNLNNHQEQLVQYQAPAHFYDHQNQQRFNEMSFDLNHNLRHGTDQCPDQQVQSFMDLLVGQHPRQMMGYNVEEHRTIPSVDDGNHHQPPPTTDLATTTSHMPSTTADLFALNTNNNRWPTRLGL